MQMTCDEFEEKYPKIAAFLLNFIIQAYEDISDDEVMNKSSAKYYRSEKEAIIALKEARKVLELDIFPKDAIEEIMTVGFDTEEETKTWLKDITRKMEKKIAEALEIIN